MDDFPRPTVETEPRISAVLPGAIGADLPPGRERPSTAPRIPDYLQETYNWAYLNPRNVRLLDRDLVVRTILWQQHGRLQRMAFAEIEPGQSVLQSACVYGGFSANLADHIGCEGSLDIVDVAEVQVNNARRKLEAYPHVRVHHGNVLHLDERRFDTVCCYFLLHELPDLQKGEAVNVLLNKLRPGGKAAFVDYHKPRWWHPLKAITSLVFDTLEPFAKSLWRKEIVEFARYRERYHWRKETIFGGLFQKVVATRVD